MSQSDTRNRRVLIVDDNEAIHADIRKVLCRQADTIELDAITAAMLNKQTQTRVQIEYDIDSAYQGQEGLAMVTNAIEDGRPYAIAFVDMRMPPGWDGLETIKRLWEVDSMLQIVICTAYSDHSLEDIHEALDVTDRLLVLKKPFDDLEVSQFACSLTEKWNLASQNRQLVDNLEQNIEKRTLELQQTNVRLEREILEHKRTQEQLRHDALHDSLTGLPNRAMLMEHMRRCVERSKGEEDYIFAVLFLDLDDFKVINDSLGHRCGDELLTAVADRLGACLHLLDCVARPVKTTTARLGGDEFVILLDGLKDISDASVVAESIRDSLTRPYHLSGHDVVTTVSIGIATSLIGYERPDDLLRDADIALYQAKAQGKDRHLVFDNRMHDDAMMRLHIETEMRKAVESQQLLLKYQPIVDMKTGVIAGFEALLRWRHPERGLIPLDDFIPIAEETGLIVPIGEWVFRKACRQSAIWQRKFPDHPLTVSVNLSSKQCSRAGLIQMIDDALDETDCDPGRIKLEITETLIMEVSRTVNQVLDDIRGRGIALHMDDFGTGYSSLSYLHTLPIEAIKIDRSFVSNMGIDGKHAATIQAVVTLAHNRNMKVIAEGVESDGHLAQLQALECDFGQGFFFSEPIDADQAEKLLAHKNQRLRSA